MSCRSSGRARKVKVASSPKLGVDFVSVVSLLLAVGVVVFSTLKPAGADDRYNNGLRSQAVSSQVRLETHTSTTAFQNTKVSHAAQLEAHALTSKISNFDLSTVEMSAFGDVE